MLTQKPWFSGATLSDTTALRPTFTIDIWGEYKAALVVTDGTTVSVADTVTVTTWLALPVSNAKRDRAPTVGQLLYFDGRVGYDADGAPWLFAIWELLSRPAGSQAVISIFQPWGLVPDVPGTYVVQFELTDGWIRPYSVPEAIVISTENVPPFPDAGDDQAASVGAKITLDGARSYDVDADLINYRWALTAVPEGSTAALSDSSAVRPTFTVDVSGNYVAQLITDDGALESRPDTVVISTENSAPVADGGPNQFVAVNDLVQLDGTGSSDADNDALTYRWAMLARPGGSAAALSDSTSLTPTFTADVAGAYSLQLIVHDGTTFAVPARTYVSTGLIRAVADAGADQVATVGQAVQLDGSGSYSADQDPLIYQWAVIAAPEDSAATITELTTASPTFTPDVKGAYVLQLVVANSYDDGNPDTMVIEANSPPVADAGADQSLPAGSLVQLNGAGSIDPDDDPLDYDWSITVKPGSSAATLSDPTSPTPAFTADVKGGYVVSLTVSDGTTSSSPDTVSITALDRLPLADVGVDQTVTAGAVVQVDGSGSSDPDSDPISAYAWTLAAKPQASTAVLSDPASSSPTFTADATGVYVAELVVTAAGAGSIPASVVITAEAAPNAPPVLDLVGNKFVDLGSTLAFELSATDPEDDPITFVGQPSPLPAGASLHSMSGAFSFQPNEGHVGTHDITFIASDGIGVDSETITITVVAPAPGTQTTLTGRVLDTNAFVELQLEVPVIGATVSIIDSGVSSTTDSNGDFTLVGLPAGAQVFDIDATTADLAPDGSAYAGFREALVLVNGAVNVVERAFYLPRIDGASLTTVDPDTTTMVISEALDITLEVAPHTAKNPDGTDFTGELSISEVADGLAPAALPGFLDPGLVITIQPVGVTFATPAPITFPNTDGLPPGSEADIWSLDPDTGTFVVVGIGEVSPDGSEVVTISGGIRAADWHMVMPPQPNGVANFLGDFVAGAAGELLGIELDSKGDLPGADADCSGSASAGCTGSLTVVHTVPTTRSLGRAMAPTLIYSSTAADPQPILTTNSTIPLRSAVPVSLSVGLEIAGQDLGEVFTSTSDPEPLSEGVDETVIQAVQFDAAEFATGAHDYELTLTSNFAASSIGRTFSGQVLVANEIESPFGAGWTLDGLQRLRPQANGGMVLTLGDGTTMYYAPLPAGSIVFEDFADVSSFTLLGAAATLGNPVDVGGQPVLRLTLAQTHTAGAAYLTTPTALTDAQGDLSFSSVFEFEIADASLDADGLTFAIIPPPPALGGTGGALGIYPISPSLAVEFDSFDNNPEDEDDDNHVGININGNIASEVWERVTPTWHDGGIWTAWVDYDAASDLLEVRVNAAGIRPQEPNLTYTVDLVQLLGDTQAHFGFTAGTGGLPQTHDVRSWTFMTFPPGGGGALSDEFVSPAGDFSTLIANADGTFTRTLKNGTTIEFDAAGLMTAVLDRNGNATIYAYDGQDRIDTITDPVGRQTTFAYTGDHLASITDPAGRATAFVRDAAGNLVKIIDADGSERMFAYDARHRMVGQVSKRGFVTEYAYDHGGRFAHAFWPDGSERDTQADEVAALVDPASGLGSDASPAPYVRPEEALGNFTDGNGHVTVRDFDGFGQTVQALDPLSRLTLIARDADGRPTAITSALGRLTEIDYDSRGNPLEVREGVGDALERATALTWTPDFNLIESITDPAGIVTSFAHDGAGNLLTMTEALGDPELERETTFTYRPTAPFGLVETVTDPRQNATSYTYDSLGNVETVTDAEGNVTRLERDDAGRVELVIEGDGTAEERRTAFAYDALDRITAVTLMHEPASGDDDETASFAYDAEGNLAARALPTGETTIYAYDSRGRVAAVDDPASGLTTYTYDGDGNLELVTDAKGNVTQYVYDPADRAIEVIELPGTPEEQLRQFAYDGHDNLTAVTDARGNATGFAYDLLDRRTSRTQSPDGGATELVTVYGWNDPRDLMTSLTRPEGHVLAYVYDALGRLETITTTEADGVTPDDQVDLGYDAADNLVLAADDDSDLSFTYDGLDRPLTETTNPAADPLVRQPTVTLTHGWNAVGDRDTLTADLPDASQLVQSYVFDRAGRMTRITPPGAAAIDLGYDPNGRLEAILYPNGITTELTYDPVRALLDELAHVETGVDLDRLGYDYDPVGNVTDIADALAPAEDRSFAYDDLDRLVSAGTAAAPESYAYDPEGNRTVSHLSSSHTVDGLNRLTADDAFTYAYDDNGNLVAKTDTLTLDETAYAYDAFDRLVGVTRPDTSVVAYAYDALGRRIEKDAAGAVTQFVYDGADILLEYDASGPTPVLAATFAHGPFTDQPLAQSRGGSAYYYHADHQGSVTRLTDALGFTVSEYRYDAYGRIVAGFEGVANPYAFTGREWDPETGLYHYRARTYDPLTGRFLQQDPLGLAAADLNLYRYVRNNPVNMRDPDGQFGIILAVPLLTSSPAIAAFVEGFAYGLGLAIATMHLARTLDGDDVSDDETDDNSKAQCEPDEDDECDKLYRIDTDTCNAITRARGRKAGALCHASAAERYAACLASRPLPPLNTWNN